MGTFITLKTLKLEQSVLIHLIPVLGENIFSSMTDTKSKLFMFELRWRLLCKI